MTKQTHQTDNELADLLEILGDLLIHDNRPVKGGFFRAGANRIRNQRRANERMAEALEVIALAERALVDHFVGPHGLDADTARSVAWICSGLLVKHGRESNLERVGKTPDP